MSRRRQFFQGRALHGGDVADLAWFTPAGTEMDDDSWNEAHAKSLALFLGGTGIERDQRGEIVDDDTFLWLVNAWSEPIEFTLPDEHWGARWRVVIDTVKGFVGESDADELVAGDSLTVSGHSIVLLVRVEDEDEA